MKLVSFVVMLGVLSSLLSPFWSVETIEPHNTDSAEMKTSSLGYVFEAVSDADYHAEEEGRVIYGNYSDFDSSLLYTLVHDESKICIFYDLDLSDNLNDSHEIMRNNAVVYYYKNNIPYVHSYRSNATEVQSLINDINNYVNEVLSEMDDEDVSISTPKNFLKLSPYTTGTEDFEVLYAGSFREDEKPYGYIHCDYVVRKYGANDVNSLYLVESNISFTPGKIANGLGDTDYADWYNSSGYIKIKAMRASNQVDYNQVGYGGTPVFKDAYHVNIPGTVSNNPSISYAYSKNYQIQEPALSAQKDPSDVDKYTWLYTYSDPRNEANHLQFGYMFEMNNSGHDWLDGDLALRFEYRMTVDNNGWWIFNETNTFSGYTYHNYY